jgi:hypothetical protein
MDIYLLWSSPWAHDIPFPISVQASATCASRRPPSTTYGIYVYLLGERDLHICPCLLGIKMCERLGITQDDPCTSQCRRNCVYLTVFLRPRFIHSARVLGVVDARSNTVEEGLAGWSSKLGRAESLTGCAEPSKEGPDRRTSDGGIECVPIGTEEGQNGVQDLRRRSSRG